MRTLRTALEWNVGSAGLASQTGRTDTVLGRTRVEIRSRRRSRRLLTIWLGLVAGLSVLALACAGASWGGNGYDPAADVNSMY